MSLAIEPLVRPPDATVEIPGSKSITNRALVVAALASGRSRLTGALRSDDTVAMVGAVRALGATVAIDTDGTTLTVDGVGGTPGPGPRTVHVNQSGTVARFITPVVALGSGRYLIDAHPQMRARPMAELLAALESLGVRVEPDATPGHLPVTVHSAGLRGGVVQLPGHVSSQFVSGLLLAAPCGGDELVVELTTEPVSAPYLAMTVAVQRSFGATIAVSDDGRRYTVAPTGYTPADYPIEPDASSASYFFAAAATMAGRVRVPGLHRSSLQGDIGFVDVLAEMGADVRWFPDAVEVRGGPRLRGGSFDLRDLSDTVPTLAVVAARAEGRTKIDGVGFIRAKESDRIAAVVTELTRCGIAAAELPDGLVVDGPPAGSAPEPHGAVVHCYDDHRIAMAFTVLGLAVPGIELDQPECVNKTFPGFFDAIDRLRNPGRGLTVIAIDGPAGSGKSTVARQLGERLGLEHLDTGAMYRAVAHAALGRGVDPADAEMVAEVARSSRIEPDGEQVSVDGVDASAAIRGPAVTRTVSAVAANPEVRVVMRDAQRLWAGARGGGVLEGRDIGTVVFPDATLKVYLTASPEERARRRAEQTGQPVDEVLAEIRRRDGIDSGRVDSPLTEADDAVVLDTTGLSVDEVVDRLVALLDREEHR